MEKNTVLLRNRMSPGTLGQACGVLAAPVVVSFSLMLVPTAGVRGQDPTVKAHADPPEVAVGEQFRLVVEVGGVGAVESVTVPERFDFVQGSDRSEPTVAVKVASGEDPGSANSFTLTYVLVAREPGFFEVGPFRIIADGRSLETEPVAVLVDRQSSSAAVVKTRVEPSRIHVGDEFTLTAEIFGSRSRAHEFIAPDVFDFSHRMSTSGMRSDTHRSWRLQAAEAGELAIGPVRIVANGQTYASQRVSLVVNGRRRRRSPVRRVALRPRREGQLDLGTPVVEAGFWGVEARGREEASMIVTSEPYTLEVLPLPDEGRPASFKGHVGTLEVVSRVDRTRAEVGETIALQVEVSVEGLVEGLPDPEIEFPRGFAVSEPDIGGEGYYRRDGMGRTRTYTYLLSAVAPGSYVVPAVEMSYFHAETGSYGTTRSHPFTVTVVPAGSEAR